VAFYCPDICIDDARRHVPIIAAKRGTNPAESLEILEGLTLLIEPIDRTLYEAHEKQARARIQRRDPDDWPILAASLLLNCPIWTEDQDFFGSGVATWTTENIELFLRDT
jgi:predicted nucleic acid-binding protein